MSRIRALPGLAILVLLIGGLLSADDKKPDTEKKDTTPAKARGQLPTGWSALKLSEAQKEKIYEIQTDYRTQIQELETKIKNLRQKQQADLVRVLTPQQRAQLRDVLEDKPGDSPGKTEPKKPEAKPAAAEKKP